MNVLLLTPIAILCNCLLASGLAAGPLQLIYPPQNHRTTSASLYFVGSAPPGGTLRVNGQPVPRNQYGYFAWTTLLAPGTTAFNWDYEDARERETIERRVTRQVVPTVPRDRLYLAARTPVGTQQVRVGDTVCLEAEGTPGGRLEANLAGKTLAMPELPPYALPVGTAQMLSGSGTGPLIAGRYSGCLKAPKGWRAISPTLTFRWAGQVMSRPVPARITAVEAGRLNVVEVTAGEAIVRAGSGPGYARLTPLVRGVRTLVTGVNGDWMRLEGEGWIARQDVRVLPVGTAVPRSNVGALSTRRTASGSELVVPLEMRLPFSVRQEEGRLVVTVWGGRAQTDLIRFVASDPLIRSVQWETANPEGMRFFIDLRSPRQWGYQVRYEGTTLVVGVRKAPVTQGLSGLQVMLDPGHGGSQPGSTGPSGIAEKTVNLAIALRLRDQLRAAGATVLMTRTDDRTVSLGARGDAIARELPTVFLSLHNNALPDSGDPLSTYGTSVYWYQMQSRSLAETLHRQLINDLERPDYGLYWDSLAVIRPTAAPAVLLEFGFMTNPDEYALLNTAAYQERIARSVTAGLMAWLYANPG